MPAKRKQSARPQAQTRVSKRAKKADFNASAGTNSDGEEAKLNGDGSITDSVIVRPAVMENANSESSPNYWLMKAEPDSRLENGVDVKFSIDDLRAAVDAEPWDGVRNHVAKNNMKAMRKGDLGFFYHSNCKVPGIAGTLAIAKEATIDESAFDPNHPYYDAKSVRESPRWYNVHVAFRSKFPELLSLKKLQEFKADELCDMQLLKQSRLSVSKVSKQEWDFINSLVDETSA